jgi:hypothetical protein
MGTILIQKGNSITATVSGTSPGSGRNKQRALKPDCGFSTPTNRRLQKSSLTYFSLFGYEDAVGRVAQQGKQSQYNSEVADITRRFRADR